MLLPERNGTAHLLHVAVPLVDAGVDGETTGVVPLAAVTPAKMSGAFDEPAIIWVLWAAFAEAESSSCRSAQR